MGDSNERPELVVVHDDSIVADATIDLMRSKNMPVRATSWNELDLGRAMGIITIPPVRGESSRLAASRVRLVLDAASDSGARVVQAHHPGALGRTDGAELGADSRAIPDSEPYFHREYVREMELYPYLERGVHIVPVVLGIAMTDDGDSDWQLREGMAEWAEILRFGEREIDLVRVDAVASGLLAALQNARAGRRYVFGGRSRSLASLAEVFSIDASGGISPAQLGRGIQHLSRLSRRAQRIRHGLEPLFFGASLDSTRARGELGYMPRAPILD